jgi:hypothetical protein
MTVSTIEIDHKASRSEIDAALSRFKSKKRKLNIDRYFGKIKFDKDGLEWQKQIRNEWK